LTESSSSQQAVWQYVGWTLLASADVILLGFCLLALTFVFLLGCGSGLTIFKFHHIAKPCPICGNSLRLLSQKEAVPAGGWG